ncbi:MAG TPA: ABC transporter permease, partial [Candidatus Acidoferrales bacterium]
MKLPFGRRKKNEELDAEIGAHLEASIRERMERGATRAEAEAAARREFGNVALVKDTTRDVWGWTWIEHLGQDLRFGVRMMRKYPGLTLVGVVGMAVAIAIAAGAFGIIETVLDPVLPLDEPDRLVAIQIWDTKAQNTERRVLHDFAMWREELRSIEDLSAFYHVRRNLIVPGAQPEVISVAEMTASGFRAARVRPLLGRTLLPEDEREGAQPVVVIGYNAWRTRFASDPSIIGSTIQLGDTFHTVVGVMPDGFEFPVIDQWWIPLGTSLAGLQPLTGPQIFPFGRLAPGATRESAQTELTTLGRRAADAFPETHAQLRPQVVPYTHPPSDLEAPEDALALRSVQYFVVMLLVIVSVNVAILVYARTATRQGEI